MRARMRGNVPHWRGCGRGSNGRPSEPNGQRKLRDALDVALIDDEVDRRRGAQLCQERVLVQAKLLHQLVKASDWPSDLPTSAPSARISTSGLPPAADGTTRRIGRDG